MVAYEQYIVHIFEEQSRASADKHSYSPKLYYSMTNREISEISTVHEGYTSVNNDGCATIC